MSFSRSEEPPPTEIPCNKNKWERKESFVAGRNNISEEDIELLVKLQLGPGTSQPMMGVMLQKSLLRGHSQNQMFLTQAEQSLTRAKSDNINTNNREEERFKQSQQELRNAQAGYTKNNPRGLQTCQFNYKKDKMRFYQEQQQHQNVKKDKVFVRGNSQPQLPLRSHITEDNLTRNISPHQGVKKKTMTVKAGSSQNYPRIKDKMFQEGVKEFIYPDRMCPRKSHPEHDLMRTMSDNKIETCVGPCSPRHRVLGQGAQGSRSEQGLNFSPERVGPGRWWVGYWRQ